VGPANLSMALFWRYLCSCVIYFLPLSDRTESFSSLFDPLLTYFCVLNNRGLVPVLSLDPGTWWDEFMARPPTAGLSLAVFFMVIGVMLGEVLNRLLFLLELLRGIFFLSKFYRTKLPWTLRPEVSDLGAFPVLLLPPIDWDLLLPESTLLPLRLLPPTEWRRFDIYLTLAFFLHWSISAWICLILAKAFL